MSKINSALFLGLLISIFGFIQSAQAGESQAQLHLPWALLNTRLQSAIGTNSSTISFEIPAYQLDAGGFQWNITNIVMNGQIGTNSSAVVANHVGVTSSHSPVQITIASIAVDQIIERVISGVTVRVHLKANCGPLSLNQPAANFSALFNLDWSSGSPVSSLQNFDLAWPAGSWSVSDFTCEGPEGLPQILHDQITERLGNAEEFRPMLGNFLSSYLTAKIEDSLAKIREPFTVSGVQAKHEFKVGAMIPVATGVLANVSVNSALGQTTIAPTPLSLDFTKLPLDRPSFLGGVDLIDQIFKAEVAAQPSYFTVDLQANKSFHDLMQSRFLQFFVFSDLMNYPKTYPFPLSIYRPVFSEVSVLDSGNLRTSFPLNGLVQSYRSAKWWTYLTLKGDMKAEVRLSVANGVLSYETALGNKGVQLAYGADYKKAFKKDSSPPSSIAEKALKGKQDALSGSVAWPAIDLGVGGQYKIDRFEWLDTSHFVLYWN